MCVCVCVCVCMRACECVSVFVFLFQYNESQWVPLFGLKCIDKLETQSKNVYINTRYFYFYI